MKKCMRLSILFLAFLLILSACGSKDGNSGSSTPSDNNETDPSSTSDSSAAQNTLSTDNNSAGNSSDDSGVAGNLFDWTKAGTYYYETETTSTYGDSVSYYRDVHAKEGEDFASVSVKMEADGTVTSQIHTFKKDDKIIVINDLEKTYAEMPPEMLALTETVQDAFGDMTKLNEGTGEINGKTLSYEEYDNNGITTRFFFEKDQIYGYISELDVGGDKIVTVSVITKQSTRIPDELFEIPTGYTEMTP